MMTARILTIASLGIVLGAPPVVAQSLSRYRAYTLESGLASIVKASGSKVGDLRTLHERPAKIQELEWRAPYEAAGPVAADPVRGVLFTFYDDQLYRVVVSYKHERIKGLTDDDVRDSVSAAYGALPMQARAADSLPLDMPTNTTVVAQWDDGASVLSLVRGSYSNEYQLVLISKQLSTRARSAMKEALRLDTMEAPQRDLDKRSKELADSRVAQEKARAVNKAAFKP
jgi:hypothetical protein